MVAFGRIPQFDERSLEFPVRTLLGPRRLPVTRLWDCYQFLDQGSEGACVGFAWAHELVATPEAVPNIDDAYARSIYYRAQELDEWPGEDYEGTSVIAGAKTVTELGWLLEYRWAFSVVDVAETLSYLGPVILGINWYEGMLNPDQGGLIHPTGRLVGGHAILARGVDVDRRVVILHNSWGASWGINGECWLTWDDLGRLLQEQGECCVPVVRVAVEPPPPPPPPPEPEPEPEPAGCLGGTTTQRIQRAWHRLTQRT